MFLWIFGIILPWALVGLGAWLASQFTQQQGRILLRLQTVEERLAQLEPAAAPKAPAAPGGLPVGAVAPDFELADLDGRRRPLAEFGGQSRLLLFFNPRCGFCVQMAADLRELPLESVDGTPVPLVISTGDAEENRRFFAEHGIRCPVVLQEKMEVAARYGAHGTPMGCLVDAEGRISSELAVGAEAVLALARRKSTSSPVSEEHPQHRGNRSLADSKLNRSGLPAGATAPDFRIQGLHGGEIALGDYRGKRVLLVFSAPTCGPCNLVTPELERLHRCSAHVQVLMVSRGDLEANLAKAADQHLTFPIGLQRQWEISREYALFATPVAYLIDANGIVEQEPAVGAEAVIAVVKQVSAGPTGERCRCGASEAFATRP